MVGQEFSLQFILNILCWILRLRNQRRMRDTKFQNIRDDHELS